MKLEIKNKMLLKLLIILKVKQNNLIKYLKILKMKNERKYLIIIFKNKFYLLIILRLEIFYYK